MIELKNIDKDENLKKTINVYIDEIGKKHAWKVNDIREKYAVSTR